MKILVLTAFYPIPNGTHERMFVHVRNKYYQKNGVDVTVLNFDAKENYEIDGIPVVTLSAYKQSHVHYDIAVSHSANLRNHYLFLKKNYSDFPRLVFFFHGHEVLYLCKDYPKPYGYLFTAKWYRRLAQQLYDMAKIGLWRSFYKRLSCVSDYVFVSNWLLERFKKNTGLTEQMLNNRCHVINNSVGAIFETESYDAAAEKKYDYITIRSNIDGSKYCVDLVCQIAERNPELKFLLIGKGKYFEYNSLPPNVEWISKTLSHEDMIGYINSSKCALMPTREDTQGVMTCELATFGIPVITSDIAVCHEMFDGLKNILYINNEDVNFNLTQLSSNYFDRITAKKTDRFFAVNTISKEISLYRMICNNWNK